MLLEIGLLAYAAFANLAIASARYRPQPYLATALPPLAAKGAAIMLMLLSASIAVQRFGPYQGPVAWIGVLSIAGTVLVLLMSRWRRIALGLWVPATLAGLLALWSGVS